ncbi:MAG: TrkA C-terminal domain-containing protein [Verrucomicrobiales bacterium]|nr:TrkA C-terminal domain-containing protein [Verrucomicrobiales bacterium]
MGSLLALLIITTVSLVIVRVGATALMMTGLSWDASNFQSYSAFFGVGFTTSEAEMVVNHPVRRRVIRDLILAGNIGVTSVGATLIVTFIQNQAPHEILRTIVLIIAGAAGLWLIFRVEKVRRIVDWLIHRSLEKVGGVRSLDYELLLRIPRGYCISELEVQKDNPFAGQSLKESRPADLGVVVLGILRDSSHFVGAPSANDRIEIGDIITVYGHEDSLKSLK